MTDPLVARLGTIVIVALPWRAPAGRRADPTSSGCRSCCSRPPWPRSATISAASSSSGHGRGLGRRPDRRGAVGLGRARLLRPRPQPPCLRPGRGRHGGRFPTEEAALLALPGIGAYTAAAIRAIAFDQPASAVDGNVEQVIARLFAIEVPLRDAKTEIKTRAARLVPAERAGDYAQAMMDLGATVCAAQSALRHLPADGQLQGAQARSRRGPAATRPRP